MSQQVIMQPELPIMHLALSDNRAISCAGTAALHHQMEVVYKRSAPAHPEDTSKIHKEVPNCPWFPTFVTLPSLSQFVPMTS